MYTSCKLLAQHPQHRYFHHPLEWETLMLNSIALDGHIADRLYYDSWNEIIWLQKPTRNEFFTFEQTKFFIRNVISKTLHFVKQISENEDIFDNMRSWFSWRRMHLTLFWKCNGLHRNTVRLLVEQVLRMINLAAENLLTTNTTSCTRNHWKWKEAIFTFNVVSDDTAQHKQLWPALLESLMSVGRPTFDSSCPRHWTITWLIHALTTEEFQGANHKIGFFGT